MTDLQFRETASTGYDRAVGHITRRVIPPLLRAACLSPGQQVFTSQPAPASPPRRRPRQSGHVAAADISPAMINRARQRQSSLPNISFAVEDGQNLPFADQSFDAVLCNMGLMLSRARARAGGVSPRTRPGGRAAVSAFTRADRAVVGGLIRAAIARHVRSNAPQVERFFAVGDKARLHSAFEGAGFAVVKIVTEALGFAFPFFDAYFGGAERGEGGGTASWDRSTWRCLRTCDAPGGRRSAARSAMLAPRSRSEWRSGLPAGGGSGRLRLARGMRQRTRTSRRADCPGRLWRARHDQAP